MREEPNEGFSLPLFSFYSSLHRTRSMHITAPYIGTRGDCRNHLQATLHRRLQLCTRRWECIGCNQPRLNRWDHNVTISNRVEQKFQPKGPLPSLKNRWFHVSSEPSELIGHLTILSIFIMFSIRFYNIFIIIVKILYFFFYLDDFIFKLL